LISLEGRLGARTKHYTSQDESESGLFS
jgi:hypothetical protein